MSGRLDPPPVVPPSPAPRVTPTPRPPFPRPAIVGTILAVAVVVVAAWWFLQRDKGQDSGNGGTRGAALVDVPSAMGPGVSAALFNRLFEAADGGGLNEMDLRIHLNEPGEKPTYVVGEPISVNFVSEDDGRCAVYHRDSAGAIQLMTDDAVGVKAGQEEEVSEWKIAEPLGEESVLVVCLRGTGKNTLADSLNQDRTRWRQALSAVRQDIEVRRAP